MALHNLKITVVDGGRSGSYKSSKKADDKINNNNEKDKNSALYKLLNAKQAIKNKVQSGMTPASVFAMDMGLRIAGQFIKQTANYYISDIGRRNGDSNYQSMVNRQIEVASDSLSVVGGALSGAATGSMFGPVGAGIGLVLGVASSAISLGFKYNEREREYQHKLFQQNTSQAFNLARANYSAFTGRAR